MKTLSLIPVLCAAMAMPALAETPDSIARLEVLPGWRSDSGTQMAGLKIILAPGWKTYWRAPGDAGIPPLLDWTGSQNITNVAVHWPTPEVFDLSGMRTAGYSEGVVLPIELSTVSSGEPFELRGRIEMGVCEEICVPVSFDFTATLPAATKRDPQIVASLVDQPNNGTDAGASRPVCVTDATSDGLQITYSVTLPPQGGSETVVIEAGDDRIWTSEALVGRSGNQLTATAEMIQVDGRPFLLNRSAVRVTVFGASGAVEIQGCTGG